MCSLVVLVLEVEVGLSRGLLLVPLMAERSSLVKLELMMETSLPSNPDLPNYRIGLWAC